MKEKEMRRNSVFFIIMSALVTIGSILYPRKNNNTEAPNRVVTQGGGQVFGIGIAFPEQVVDEMDKPRNLIGLLDFMSYAQSIIPEWMKKYPSKHLLRFENLFTITLL